MRIICDMDEVIVDMMTQLIERHRELYKSDITIEDVTQWQLPKDMVDIFMTEYFFFQLPPIKGATEGIRKLMAWGHDVIIATNHSGDGSIAGEKADWVEEFLPELANNIMIGSRKNLLQADVIIDDNADYLIGSPCPVKICMDRPWNRGLMQRCPVEVTEMGSQYPQYVPGFGDIDYRVYNWKEILALFEGGL